MLTSREKRGGSENRKRWHEKGQPELPFFMFIQPAHRVDA